jgi:TolA-binding protein
MEKPQPTHFTQSNAVQPPEQIQEQIRQRAYEIYELNGREDGHDLDDRLRAESAVTEFRGLAQRTKRVSRIAMAPDDDNEGDVSR